MAGKKSSNSKTMVIKEIEKASSAIDEKAVDISELKKETAPVAPKKEGVVFSGTVNANPRLNVRNEPNGTLILDQINNGAKVDIYQVSKGFGKISATEDRWVNLEFVVAD